MKKWQKIRLTHPNSIEAYYSGGLEGLFNEREKQIIVALRAIGCGTDREIAEHIGYDHKSAVQPRISDLINDAGILEEMHYGQIDRITGKTVRMVRIRPKENSNQLELFAC